MTVDIRQLLENQDAFKNLVNQRTNVIDLAAHYPINPERWTLKVDGTRQLPQYGTISQYNHAVDVHELSPASGETVTFRTAERPRYVVQYELAATWAFALNQSLQGNDTLKIGLYDGTDGWYLEHRGDHADDQTVDLVTERAGSVVNRKTSVDIIQDVKSFCRLRLQSGWYNITRQVWERSFSENGEQRNVEFARTSIDDGRGPQVGNLPLCFEVTADANTSGLTLEAGSCAQVNLGRTTEFAREKSTVETDTIDTTGSWVPLRAYRVDPNRDIVNVQLTAFDIGKYTANDDVELLFQSFAPSNVLDSGGNTLVDADFSIAEDFDEQNSVIETSSAVAQVADSSGATGTSVSNPGGWQLARAELFTGSGKAVAGASRVPAGVKRPVYPRDVVVVLGKSGTSGDVSYQLQFEQDF
jgi:hypothetical protein